MVDAMGFCANCGTQVTNGTNYCTNCGHRIQAAAQNTVATNQVLDQDQYQQPKATSSSKVLIVVGSLVLILAGLGVFLVTRTGNSGSDQQLASVQTSPKNEVTSTPKADTAVAQSKKKQPRATAEPTYRAHPAVGSPGYLICNYPSPGVIDSYAEPRYVAALQWGLGELNYGRTETSGSKAVVDGDYGPETAAAVARYQRKHGYYETGVATPEMWDQVQSTVRSWGRC